MQFLQSTHGLVLDHSLADSHDIWGDRLKEAFSFRAPRGTRPSETIENFLSRESTINAIMRSAGLSSDAVEALAIIPEPLVGVGHFRMCMRLGIRFWLRDGSSTATDLALKVRNPLSRYTWRERQLFPESESQERAISTLLEASPFKDYFVRTLASCHLREGLAIDLQTLAHGVLLKDALQRHPAAALGAVEKAFTVMCATWEQVQFPIPGKEERFGVLFDPHGDDIVVSGVCFAHARPIFVDAHEGLYCGGPIDLMRNAAHFLVSTRYYTPPSLDQQLLKILNRELIDTHLTFMLQERYGEKDPARAMHALILDQLDTQNCDPLGDPWYS